MARYPAARRVAYVVLLALLLGIWLLPAFGQAPPTQAVTSGPVLTIRATTGQQGHHVPARGRPHGGAVRPSFQPTIINVAYNGFSPQAQAAFAYAVSIWSQQVSSSVPISITANWTPLGAGVLGSASSTSVVRDFPGAPVGGTWYPLALANKLRGSDLYPNSSDITANFNSTFGNWYFGTDGNTPSGDYDFVSVVLHELGHGLGFYGSATVSSGNGSVGLVGFPTIYDRFTTDSAGTPLLSYTSPSAELAAALQTSPVYFTGAHAVSANGSANVRLYAPATWRSGSSYSHLDETFNGTANALMTFSLSNGESVHDPGDVTLGLLEDIGWITANTTPTATPTASPTSTATATATATATPTEDERFKVDMPLVAR